MKKRAMKKWIPKNQCYCYTITGKSRDGKLKTETCKWHKFNKNHDKQENGYCSYLNKGDWQENGTSLLWDRCKECGIKDR